MSIRLEAFLARLLVESEARARFLADPRREAAEAGLDLDECEALASIDRVGLELAAASVARKRAGHHEGRPEPSLLRRLRRPPTR